VSSRTWVSRTTSSCGGTDSSRARKGHPRRTGPRSSAGCCIAYCLRIVDLDPLRYGTDLRAILESGRRSMPDIDMDFDERFRAT